MFSHSYPESTSSFVQLHTDNTVVTLTEGHYLYVNGQLATAGSVKLGDELETTDGAQVPVIQVSTTIAHGLFNPHTIHGDIVVDGIRTSTYTNAMNPILAHSILAPARAIYSLGYSIDV